MPTTDIVGRCGINLFAVKFLIAMMGFVVVLGIGMGLPGLAFLFGEAQQALPLVPRLIGFGVGAFTGGSVVAIGVIGVRRHRRRLRRRSVRR